MGLDMYLDRMPRYRGTTPKQINLIQSILDGYELGDECNEKITPDQINYYKKYYTTKYYDWDKEHKYPHTDIVEQVGYWRKANAIHRWFVENIQNGEDDCCYHREVTESDIIELRDICVKVVNSIVMMHGKVFNGIVFNEGEFKKEYIDGLVVINTNDAEKLLPTCQGFFFGDTNYDEFYVESLVDTVRICNEVLKTTDFDTQMIYYCSSW